MEKLADESQSLAFKGRDTTTPAPIAKLTGWGSVHRVVIFGEAGIFKFLEHRQAGDGDTPSPKTGDKPQS